MTNTLFDAASDGDLDTLRALLDAGADIDKGFDSGLTAVAGAAFNGRVFAVEYLISRGADLEKANCHGVTPLLSAARESRVEVIKLLLASKVNLEQVNERGQTALLVAANFATLDTVRALLSGGANPLVRCVSGHTALCLAVLNITPKYGQLEMMRLFIEAGVDVSATTQWGTSAYSLALERKMEDKLALLQEAGAVPNTTESPWVKEARLEREAKAVQKAATEAAPPPQVLPQPPIRSWWQFWK